MTSPYYAYVPAGPVSTTPTLISPEVTRPQPPQNYNYSNLEESNTQMDQSQPFGELGPSSTSRSYQSQPHVQTYNHSPDHNYHYIYQEYPSQNTTHYASSPQNEFLPHRQFPPNQFRPHEPSPVHQIPPQNHPLPLSFHPHGYPPQQIPVQNYSQPPNQSSPQYQFPPQNYLPQPPNLQPHGYPPQQIPVQNCSQPPIQSTPQYSFPPAVHRPNLSFHTPTPTPPRTLPRQDAHKTLDNTGYCILSLDGGGIRGLSSLYILESIMSRLNKERKKTGLGEKKPCEIFDLIGGTSTGGLIAIMLGHLEMTVEECIKAYNSMMKHVFEKQENRSFVSVFGKVKSRFSSEALKEAISKVIKDQKRDPNEKFYNKEKDGEEDVGRSCKVFVTTKTQETSSITRLRNYSSLSSSHLHPTILEAALATSAAPTYFTPILINGSYFLDGALGANNPCDELESEAADLWCETTGHIQPLIKCYISVGSGHPGNRHVSDKGFKYFLETLEKEATETKATTKRWEGRWREGLDKGRCYRFNVDHGLEKVGLAEYKEAGDVMAASRTYLDEPGTKGMVRRCVENLRMKEYEPTPAFIERLKTESQAEEPTPSRALERATVSEIAELIAHGKSHLRKPPSTLTTQDLEKARHYFIKALNLSRLDPSTTLKSTARLCHNLLDTSLRLSMKPRKPSDRKENLDHAREYGEVALSNTIKCGDWCMEAQVRFLLACVEAWAVYVDANERGEAPGRHPRKRDVEMRMRERLEELRRFENLDMGVYEGQVEKFEGYLNRMPRG